VFFTEEAAMKFNVHVWTGGKWEYLATATAENEQVAAHMVAARFGAKGRFASYPHIDTYGGLATSKSSFTVIE
jgi:hypothetical protein